MRRHWVPVKRSLLCFGSYRTAAIRGLIKPAHGFSGAGVLGAYLVMVSRDGMVWASELAPACITPESVHNPPNV